MITKFLADSTKRKICRVEIVKESDVSVFIPNQWYPDGQRYDKLSANRGYFDSFNEAKDFLVSAEEERIAIAWREIKRRQEYLEQIACLSEVD